MTEPTVSVELTEDDLLLVLGHRYPDAPALVGKLIASLKQLNQGRDREAKVQALRDNVAIPRGYDHWVALDCLNAAGWDLVRVEDKKPYSEWEVRDMMNAAYRSEDK
jgi:hypothetical protein